MKVKGFYTKYIDDDEVEFVKARYVDGSTALLIRDAETGEPLGRATVCLVDYHEKPSPGNVFIKDWSENEGMLQALHDVGIIGPVLRTIPTGHTQTFECKLLI